MCQPLCAAVDISKERQEKWGMRCSLDLHSHGCVLQELYHRMAVQDMGLSYNLVEGDSSSHGFAVAQPVPEADRARRIGLGQAGLAHKPVDHRDLSESSLCFSNVGMPCELVRTHAPATIQE